VLNEDQSNLGGSIQDLKVSSDPVFNLGNAAQPGDSQEKYLRIRNEGNIAINYQVDFIVTTDSELAEVIDFEIQPLGGTTQTINGVNIDQDNYIELRDQAVVTGGLLKASPSDANEYEIWRVKMIYSPTAGNEYNDETLEFEVDIQLTAWQFNYEESAIFEITFDVLEFNVSIPPIISGRVGTNVTLPVLPELEEYTFIGWYRIGEGILSDGSFGTFPYEPVNFTKIPFENITLGPIYTTIVRPWDGLSTSGPQIDDDIVYIYTGAQLAWLKNEVNNGNRFLNKTIELMNNIDLNDKEWTPIGNEANPFQGTFDGNNFSISNLKITSPQKFIGLFGLIDGAIISNFSLSDVNINVNGSIQDDVSLGSAVAFSQDSSLSNIDTINGNISLISNSNLNNYVGGLVGYHQGESLIEYSDLTNNIEITGKSYVGGIVGLGKKLSISEAKNYGTVNGNGVRVGGLVGHLESSISSINTSVNYGYVKNLSISRVESSSTSDTGGIVGYYEGNLSNVTNYGTIEGVLRVGGIAGAIIGLGKIIEFDTLFNYGDVFGVIDIGGIIGIGYDALIIKVFNQGNVEAVYNTVILWDWVNVGGIIGSAVRISIDQALNRGDLIARYRVGGIAGIAELTSITNAQNDGEVFATDFGAGGLVGYGNMISVSASMNVGTIKSQRETGGIIGRVSTDANLDGLINFGLVISINQIEQLGQIVGYELSPSSTANNLYFTNVNIGNFDGNDGGVDTNGVLLGNYITDLTVIDMNFFISSLNFSYQIWDFELLSVTENNFPMLRFYKSTI
jgi:hypothetical protein